MEKKAESWKPQGLSGRVIHLKMAKKKNVQNVLALCKE